MGARRVASPRTSVLHLPPPARKFKHTTDHNTKFHRGSTRFRTRIGAPTMAATVLTMAAARTELAVSPFSQETFTRVHGARTSVRTAPGVRVVSMAATPKGASSGPAINTGDKVAEKVEEAQEICAGDSQSEECATAWNEVESAAAEKAKSKGTGDPLDEYCEDNPEADECRVYND